ncbi:hypothetical protein [Roseibium sp. LAB1]
MKRWYPALFALIGTFMLASAAAAQEPPRSDSFQNPEDFLACTGNPYALCYYSGPDKPTPRRVGQGVPSLPCVLDPDLPDNASCTCYAIDEVGTGPTEYNYVLIESILNKQAREDTQTFCEENGGCLNMKNLQQCIDSNMTDAGCATAPVCGLLGTIEDNKLPTLFPNLPDVHYISTFSFEFVKDHHFNSTSCSKDKYAGCMTAPCTKGEDGLTTCSCPVYDGEYQVGQNLAATGLGCHLDGDNVWSAANHTTQDSQ